jgi:hypothetical protein
MAAERKHEKYTELEKSYIFQPISFETLGPINSSEHSFICELGRRIASISGDLRATAFFIPTAIYHCLTFLCFCFSQRFLYCRVQTYGLVTTPDSVFNFVFSLSELSTKGNQEETKIIITATS